MLFRSIELYIGRLGKRLFLLFTWLFSILVVAAFADIVAGTFNGFDAATGERIAANGAVASTSMLFILFAVALGFFLKFGKCGKLMNTLAAIGLLVLAVALGQRPSFQRMIDDIEDGKINCVVTKEIGRAHV